MQDKLEVNVIAFQEGDLWVAQCVEYDIAARSKKLAGLQRAFERAFIANLCVNMELGRAGLEGIRPPPPEYVTMFEETTVSAKTNNNYSSDPRLDIVDVRLYG